MNTSTAIADPLLRQAFGRRARPSDLQSAALATRLIDSIDGSLCDDQFRPLTCDFFRIMRQRMMVGSEP
jgi:hypothetical protein